MSPLPGLLERLTRRLFPGAYAPTPRWGGSDQASAPWGAEPSTRTGSRQLVPAADTDRGRCERRYGEPEVFVPHPRPGRNYYWCPGDTAGLAHMLVAADVAGRPGRDETWPEHRTLVCTHCGRFARIPTGRTGRAGLRVLGVAAPTGPDRRAPGAAPPFDRSAKPSASVRSVDAATLLPPAMTGLVPPVRLSLEAFRTPDASGWAAWPHVTPSWSRGTDLVEPYGLSATDDPDLGVRVRIADRFTRAELPDLIGLLAAIYAATDLRPHRPGWGVLIRATVPDASPDEIPVAGSGSFRDIVEGLGGDPQLDSVTARPLGPGGLVTLYYLSDPGPDDPGQPQRGLPRNRAAEIIASAFTGHAARTGVLPWVDDADEPIHGDVVLAHDDGGGRLSNVDPAFRPLFAAAAWLAGSAAAACTEQALDDGA